MQMKTKLLRADKKKDIELALDFLSRGQIVAVPTETVYGLAADATNIEAVNKIFKAKERPQNHPLIVHISAFEKLSEWVKSIPFEAKILADKFWPGPLTLVLKKKESVNSVITGNLGTIAIRVPKEPTLLKILKALDKGLAAPSANPHKRISPTSAKHVLGALYGKIAAVLDGGDCQLGLESTILDLTEKIPRILRFGPISKGDIEAVIGKPVYSHLMQNEKVPGNMEVHYQPNTKSNLMSFEEINNTLSSDLAKNKVFGVLHFTKFNKKYPNVKAIKIAKNKRSYARLMYSSMHELDKMNVFQILIESPPNKLGWEAILDRLTKATNSNF